MSTRRARRTVARRHICVGIVVLSAILTGCGTSGSVTTAGATHSSDSGASAPAGSLSTGGSPAVSAALKDAVLRATDAPAGTTYVAQQSGPQSLEDVLHTGNDPAAARAQLQRTGYEGAYRSFFQGAEGLSALTAVQRSVATFALVFPTPDAASRARTQLDTTAKASGLNTRSLPDPRLGDASTAVQSDVAQLHGASFYYSWQQGTAVRVLIDIGGQSATNQTASLALARRMAASPAAAATATTPASALVLQRADGPRGTIYSAAQSGPRKSSDFGSAKVGTSLAGLGLRSAYATLFLTPGLANPGTGTNSVVTDLVSSSAQKYQTASDASSAYHVFLDREKQLFQGQKVAVLDSNGLGSEGAGFSYSDQSQGRTVTGVRFLWRSGDFFLDLALAGSPTFATVQAARALADKVDHRLK